MGGQEDRGGRHLVDVAHLQPDDPVLDVVDDPDAVAAADLGGALDQLDEPEPLAVERDRHARARTRPSRPRPRRAPAPGASRAGRRRRRARARGPRSTCPPSERPQRLSSIEYGARLGPALDRDAVLARVGDLLVAAHLPGAHRRDHLQLGRERRDRRLDADLVVALAGAAVGDRVAARLARVLDGELGDQRAAERGEERVAVAVDRRWP